MSLQVCHCGWSKVTTYHGLRIHQGKMGCTSRSFKVPESEQQYVWGHAGLANNYTAVGLDVYTIYKTAYCSDKSLQVCHCGWSKFTTYHGLRTHQGKMGCTQKKTKIPKREHYNWMSHCKEVDENKYQPARRQTVKKEDVLLSPSPNDYTASAAVGGTIGLERKLSLSNPQRSSLKAEKTCSHMHDFSTLPQVNRSNREPPAPTYSTTVVRPKTKDQTSQRADSKARTGYSSSHTDSPTAATIKEEPKSYMAGSLDDHSFCCPVCLEFFTDPVSTPCGHNFCKYCIEMYWDIQGVCHCPLCMKTFSERPELQINISFREVVNHFKNTNTDSVLRGKACEAEAGEVAFDETHHSQHRIGAASQKNTMPLPPYTNRCTVSAAVTDTIKVDNKPSFLTPQCSSQKATKSHSRPQYFSTLPQVTMSDRQRPAPTYPVTAEQLKKKDRKDQTLSQGNWSTKSHRDSAITVKEEPKSPLAVSQQSSQTSTISKSSHQPHGFSTGVQVNKSVRERPPIPPKVKVPPTFPAPAVRPKEQRREVQTLSQANSANSAAAEGTAKKDPKPLCEAAQPGFYTGMKVKELTQMFSGTTTQGTAVRPKKKQGEEQKVLQELSEAVKAKVTAVQPKEKDKEDPQNKADSTNANTQMNSASAETTTAEDHDTDFSGLKVKELALMFSAATTKETAVRPKMKHREEQKPSQVPDRTRADIKHKIQMREQNVTQGNSSVKAPESLQGSLDAEWLEINSVLSEVVRAAEDAQEKFLYLSLYSLRTTTTTMMEQIHQKMEKISSIELKWISKFAVDVRLDPSTAHRCFVSADGKKVSGGEVKPDAHGRFGDVLGLNRLSSGKSYWEVVVSSRSGWNLGVVRGDVNHKGKLLLNPGNGYWVTEYHDNKYAALTAPPVRLSLKAKPQKVGVFVDYEEGLVSFYDVPARSHIYSFTECRFTGEIYPYFSLYPKENGESADPLIISAVKYL